MNEIMTFNDQVYLLWEETAWLIVHAGGLGTLLPVNLPICSQLKH